MRQKSSGHSSAVVHRCIVRGFHSKIIRPVPLSSVHYNTYLVSSTLLREWSVVPVRHMSSARVIGGLFGRILKLRYIVLTGAIGGGVTAHQVIQNVHQCTLI